MENKMRLIDANALKSKMMKTSRYFDIKYDIDEAPTVDAVEVVRCKDCKYWMYEYDETGLCVVDVPDIDGVQRQSHDYCSYGERRSNG